MVVFRPGLNYWYWKVLLWIIYLDMNRDREITLQVVVVVAGFASLNLSLPFSYRRMMLWLHAPAHPSVLSSAAELLYTMRFELLKIYRGHGYGSGSSFWQRDRTKHFLREKCYFLCMEKESSRSRAKQTHRLTSNIYIFCSLF